MAILVGVIIGISKMQGDSELTAIRAAGTSNLQITIPVIVLGILLSLFAFLINLKGVPIAAQVVRKVAAQTALYKLQSPIEPGVFNTEIQGSTIYVKDGDVEKGTWKNIFIYSEDSKTRQTRLITSQNGRIDSKNDSSELVLEKASINTFSNEKPYKNLFSEKVEELRYVIQTKRGEIVNKLSKTEESPEEMGLSELAAFAKTRSGREKTEADILWQRRLTLSFTPLLFAILGASLVLRFNRGGKGFGIFLALISLVCYYLIALMGEQLARTGSVSVLFSSLLPYLLTSAAIAWFFLSPRISFNRRSRKRKITNPFKLNAEFSLKGKFPRTKLTSLTVGIMDFDIVVSLLKYFLLTLGFLSSVYLLFTAFELWKFAGSITNGISLLLKYLFFLLPFVYIQIAPSALMIAMLATYIIKTRQNEIVTWTASGQSIYRLLFPCFVLMMAVGFVNWEIQERLLPQTNRIQDSLRAQLRNNGVLTLNAGKYWVANENRIYSFELPGNVHAPGDKREVRNLTVYQFAETAAKLEALFKTDTASWEKGKIRFLGEVEKTVWKNDIPSSENISGGENEIVENYNPFRQTSVKPNHINSEDLVEQIKTAESESERRMLSVALQKKYITPFLPLVLTLFTSPFALALGRNGKAASIGYAVGLWLAFMGISNFFEQFGTGGFIAPEIAIWSPLLLFSLIGGYFLSRVRT
jgi:lipopolysaccharide export LptBFGC system permease protein LptF